MLSKIRPHLTYANVISTLALLLVVSGGVSYAATGDFLILGQANSASKATRLNSGSLDSALKVTDTRTGNAVWASGGSQPDNTAAVHGESTAGNAVEGFSTGDPASGVYGQDNNANSYGVAGHSDNGVAVVGDSSSGWAVQSLGNVAQTRASGGWVKAMAEIDPFGDQNPPLGDHIFQCFNSQRPPAQATSGNCGLTYDRLFEGGYEIDFGFKVSDRFASLTLEAGHNFGQVQVPGASSNSTVAVTTEKVETDADCSFAPCPTDQPFFIFVY
jgi:hypothetical protein